MNFQEEMQKILKREEGAEAAMLMGTDGIAIAEAKREGLSIACQDVAVEYTRVLSDALKVAQAMNLGRTEELSFSTEKFRIVFRFLGDNYFLALFLRPDAALGRGRFLLRKLVPALQAEL